ncbi:MAG: hypothetical protein RBS72_17565, partial [Sedimentisphaerales bacterium]|nr:hypothetical protein [Sedimentisphaerales bacterium]
PRAARRRAFGALPNFENLSGADNASGVRFHKSFARNVCRNPAQKSCSKSWFFLVLRGGFLR